MGYEYVKNKNENENENLQCQTCPAGFSQSNQGQPFCLPCSSGTFSIDGQSKCATKKNKKKSKNIYGKATSKEVEALKEEGIETEVMPWIGDKEN